MKKKSNDNKRDANLDPITKEPGAHPVGTGVGATLGGAAGGAALGAAGFAAEGALAGTAVAGPVGTVVGAVAGIVAGAVGGGLAGKALAEKIDPTVEEKHWQDNYRNRPYVEKGSTYDDYGPAYRYGWEGRLRYPGKSYEEIESELESGWNEARGESELQWDRARHATRDAWDRVSGNADRRPLPKKG